MALHDYSFCPKFEQGTAEDDVAKSTRNVTQEERPTSCRKNSTGEKDLSEPSRTSLFVSCKRWLTEGIEGTILSLYLTAFVCALVHYLFFAYLNHRTTGSHDDRLSLPTTSISQSYATTISLLLVTAFRAALVGSVGICYTQYLWATFRRKVLRVSVIEDLFQIQSNALRFINHALFVHTPYLVVIMGFSWLIPIATIYPPGALVVRLELATFNTRFNVSTFDRDTKEHPELLWAGLGSDCTKLSYVDTNELKKECEVLDSPGLGDLSDYLDRDDRSDLILNTRKSLIVGDVLNFNHHEGENSTYTIDFWGIDLDCESANHTIAYKFIPNTDRNPMISESKLFVYGNFPAVSINYDMSPLKPPHTVLPAEQEEENRRHFAIPWTEKGTVTFDNAWNRVLPIHPESVSVYKSSTCIDDPQQVFLLNGTTSDPKSDIEIQIPSIRTTCKPKFVKYNLTVAYRKSVREISYHKTQDPHVLSYQPRFDLFNGTFELWEQLTNALSIYDSFIQSLLFTIQANGVLQLPLNGTTKAGTGSLPNGTKIDECSLDFAIQGFSRPVFQYAWAVFWDLTVFGRRTPSSDLVNSTDGFALKQPIIDPSMLREALSNSTISALSLDRRYQLKNGTIMKAVNVYQFEHKMTFFLPYALCLALALPVLLVGYSALHHNGTSAISGGFLQILTTTTGQTRLRIVAAESCMGGRENISSELKDMEIRYGELIDVCNGHSGVKESQDPSGRLNQNNSGMMINGLASPTDQVNAATAPKHSMITTTLEQGGVEKASSGQLGFGTVDETRPILRWRGDRS